MSGQRNWAVYVSVSVCTMESYSARENYLAIYENMDGPWGIMWIEISQTEKEKYHMVSFICGI